MCVVSMVMQDKIDDWNQRFWTTGEPTKIVPLTHTPVVNIDVLEQLLIEVKDLKRLLIKAKEYDEKTNQPDCESEDKKRVLKEMAEKLGVTIEFPE